MLTRSSPETYEETGLGSARFLVGQSRLLATKLRAPLYVDPRGSPTWPAAPSRPSMHCPVYDFSSPTSGSPGLPPSPFPPFSPPVTSTTPRGPWDNPACLKSLLSWRASCQLSSAFLPGPERGARPELAKEQETWAESLSCP